MHGRFCNTCRARPLPRRSRRPPRRGKASGAARTGGKRESRALAPGGGRAPGRGRKSWSFRLGFTRAPGGLFLCCPLLVYSSPCMPPCHVPCCSSTPLLSLSLSSGRNLHYSFLPVLGTGQAAPPLHLLSPREDKEAIIRWFTVL